VRWHAGRTYFGRVVGPDPGRNLLLVRQEDGGPEWGLSPVHDHIFPLGR
jgi:hypothetical protein